MPLAPSALDANSKRALPPATSSAKHVQVLGTKPVSPIDENTLLFGAMLSKNFCLQISESHANNSLHVSID